MKSLRKIMLMYFTHLLNQWKNGRKFCIQHSLNIKKAVNNFRKICICLVLNLALLCECHILRNQSHDNQVFGKKVVIMYTNNAGSTNFLNRHQMYDYKKSSLQNKSFTF